ncbi:MAG: alpha/beta hydrolase, partial [Acidobacteriaceae bacterium]|nr:alpha/beta hydrolase [Acidobacteriaceae bacterium]
MSLFVLVHGSWHDGAAWEAVVRRLESKGHKALAPTIAGHGKNATRKGITHAHCTQSITDFIRSHDLRDVVLVGHSFGGT